jgi:carboxymethylenebutenolidase
MLRNETDEVNQARRRVLSIGAAGLAAVAAQRLRPCRAEAQPGAAVAKGAMGKMNLVEHDITFRSGADTIPAFRAAPVTQPKAAIIIIHEIFGLNVHIRDVARRFARQGYLVLAPDLFSREGAPNFDASNRKAMMDFLAAIPDRRVVGDLQAAIEYLTSEGARKIGSIGFCMGGLYSYLLACKSDRLDAAVDFYGRVVYAQLSTNKPESPLDLAPELKCPLLCNFGEQDASIPQSDVQQLREKLQESTQPWTVNVYPGAGHAFFNDTRPSYNAEAAADAGTQTLEFLKKYLQTDAD